VLRDHDRDTERRAGRWMLAGLVVTVLLGAAWYLIGALGLDRTHAQALASVAGHRQWQVTALWAGAATLLPILVLWAKPTGFGWLVGLVGLHAAWMFRWTVFIGGQTVPKTGAGLYTYQLPLGHDGLLGIAGTLGLWLFVTIVLTSLLPPPDDARIAGALMPAE
jgi:tetrathionate reductase subunit C